MSDTTSYEETTESRRIMDGTPIGIVVPRRSNQQTQRPIKFRYYALMTNVMNFIEPLNYEQDKDNEYWVNAMNEEYNFIMRNKTWDLVEFPKDKIPIGSKWLFKSNFKADGSINKLKARLVAKGYSQQEGIDCEETYALVAKLNTIRILVALATKQNWRIHRLDVKYAFFNGDLKEEVYLVHLEGFVQNGQEHLVCRLNKAIYGLK